MFGDGTLELAITKLQHKDLLILHRKTATAISKIKLVSLSVDVSIHFKSGGPDLCIAVFDCRNDNVSLYTYDFDDIEKASEKVKELIAVIKKDNFTMVKEKLATF